MVKEITVPGVYDIDADDYHADPVPGGSLSSSGARKLMPPSCPALFRYEQLHGQAPKREFDIGHAAHKYVLGSGPELVVVDAKDWRTNKAKEQAKAAREAGAVPLLTAQHDEVQAMAEAIRRHPIAGALFNPLGGQPEQSLFWRDEATGLMRRARLDWLPFGGTGRLIVPDYKTAHAVDPDSIQKAVNQHAYYMQAAWYLDAVQALGLADENAAFIFVFQLKSPPYLVTPAELDVVALKIGRALNRQAIEKYVTCVETGRWESYSDGIVSTPLPAWAETRLLEEIR